MDLKKRLFRKPFKTLLWQLVLIAMAVLIGVTGSLVYASGGLLEILGEHHTTIAVQSYYERPSQFGGNEPKVQLFPGDLKTIERQSMVEMIDMRTLTGAYIPELSPDLALAKWGDLHQQNYDYLRERYLNDSYNQVAVIGTVEKSWSVTDSRSHPCDLSVLGIKGKQIGYYSYAIMNVEEIVVMNDEFHLFPTEEFSEYNGKVFIRTLLYANSEEEWLEGGKTSKLDEEHGWFEEGARYIVSGSYNPSCFGYGTEIMHTPDGIHLPWIETERRLMASCSYGISDEEKIVAYTDYESDWELNDSGELETEVAVSAGKPIPIAQKFEGSLEEFLAKNPDWQEQIEVLEASQHAFPVLGTEAIETMQYFVTNAAGITSGRTFTEEEYENGEKVCIISEALAENGGISVGDTLSFSQYLVPETYAEGNASLPESYSTEEANDPSVGNRLVPYVFVTEDEKFTVVGIYRLERSWEDTAFSFTPNTIFIPQKAQIEGGFGGPAEVVEHKGDVIIEEEDPETGEITQQRLPSGYEGPVIEEKDPETGKTTTIQLPSWYEEYPNGSYGVFMSIKLKNGTMEEFLEAIGKTELLNYRFLTYDQGYENLKENIRAVVDSATNLFLSAAAGWILLLMFYVLLYQNREKHNLGTMRSVGSGIKKARNYLFLSGFIPTVSGITIGSLLSGIVSDLVSEKLITLTLTQAESNAHSGGIAIDNTQLVEMLSQSEIPLGGILLIALLQIIIIGIVLWLHSSSLSKKSPRNLMGV